MDHLEVLTVAQAHLHQPTFFLEEARVQTTVFSNHQDELFCKIDQGNTELNVLLIDQGSLK